jgi:hypothetical protein
MQNLLCVSNQLIVMLVKLMNSWALIGRLLREMNCSNGWWMHRAPRILVQDDNAKLEIAKGFNGVRR